MKTTLNLDDHLVREAKKRAAEEGTTLTHIVEEALRGALTPRPRGDPYRFKPEVVRGDRPLAVDVADRDALYEFMDDE
ncbi:MAG: type II toxin-antitoxin system VapB family antitoxin [Actinomycetota bacterium]|nr:type II toxin-antitoxin system VapB family antitoxin [Actinomycetota bacterium]